ncbi:MAG: DegV family protein [Lachnospiraceae bacterium]|jgi:DegV family protein with EDD domain|nr:DegV family protein [Lachnospiraceae bacterium]
MFKIITDSGADLPEGFLEENDVTSLYLPVTMDGISYRAAQELPGEEFYQKLKQGAMPTTSQMNPQEAAECFRQYLAEGTAVLYLALSSGLSGTYNSARIGADMIKEEMPDAKLAVVDTLSASVQQGLLVCKAVQLRNEGKTLEEVVKYVEENRQNFHAIFTVDDLFHLHRGGRVSKASAIVGTLAQIKPVLRMNGEGKIEMLNKVRGRKKSLQAVVDTMEEQTSGQEEKNDMVLIGYGDCAEDAESVKALIQERFGIEKVLLSHVCPTIGAHTGAGIIVLAFAGKKR